VSDTEKDLGIDSMPGTGDLQVAGWWMWARQRLIKYLAFLKDQYRTDPGTVGMSTKLQFMWSILDHIEADYEVLQIAKVTQQDRKAIGSGILAIERTKAIIADRLAARARGVK